MTTATNKATTTWFPGWRHQTSFRIVAESPRTGDEVVLFTARSLEQIFERIERDGDDLANRGYSAWALEDNSLGRGIWTATLVEHLRALVKTGELSPRAFRELRTLAG